MADLGHFLGGLQPPKIQSQLPPKRRGHFYLSNDTNIIFVLQNPRYVLINTEVEVGLIGLLGPVASMILSHT